jgi:flagellar hook-associated protein 2
MADEANFRAGGLASGLDTNAIVDQLAKLEARPLDALRRQQTGFQSQVSLLGSLISKIGAFQTAAKALSDAGALGVKATSTNTAFTATPTSGANAGTYNISVQKLAAAEQDRSAAFGAAETVKGGTITISINGTTYDPITIDDGVSLETAAAAIRASGIPVSATVLNNGTSSYLSITNRNTGYTTATAADALVITENLTGPLGTKGLTMAAVVDAENAQFTIDALAFVRQSNTITDAIPNTTLALKSENNVVEKLTLDYDSGSTSTNIQKFVDAYNDLVKSVRDQLAIGGANSDRNSSLAGDSSLRSLLSRLRGTVTATVAGLGGVRNLADLGLKTNTKDGTLSIDTAKLTTAMTLDSAAVNKIFSEATTGVGALSKSLWDDYTNIVDGVFTTRKKNLNTAITRMDRDAEKMQARIDSFKRNLITQFSAMEQIVSGFKATGNFLASQQMFGSS